MEKKNEKKRSEHLSTTIGDLLKVQGNDILKTEKKPYKKNNKNKKNKNFSKKPQEKKQVVEEPKVEEPKVNDSLKKAIDEAVKNGVLRADDTTKFDMRTPEQIETDKYKDGVVVKDGTMEELAAAFFAEPVKEGPKMDDCDKHVKKFTINAEYITESSSDARVRTDEFIKK